MCSPASVSHGCLGDIVELGVKFGLFDHFAKGSDFANLFEDSRFGVWLVAVDSETSGIVASVFQA